MPPNTINAPMGIDPQQYNDLQEYGRRTGADVYPHVARANNPDIGAPNPIVQQMQQMQQVQPGASMPLNTTNPSQFLPRYPAPFQERMEKLFNTHVDRLQSLYDPNQAGIKPILNQYRRTFATETLPGIAERFTAGGGSGSHAGSNFLNRLSGAGATLESNLAALEAQYNLQEKSQLLNNLGNLNPYEQVYQENQGLGGAAQPQLSKWEQFKRHFLKTLGGAATGAAGGFITGGGPWGALAGGVAGATAGLANSLAAGDVVSPQDVQQIYTGLRATRGEPGAPKNENGITADQQAFLDELSKRAGRPLTADDVQQIQAITGQAVGAEEDFKRTYKQPGTKLDTYAQRIKQRQSARRAAAANPQGVA
jgi:hypothetical protein